MTKPYFVGATPKVADFCHQHGLAYPVMEDDGGIVNLNQWYAHVLQNNAILCE